MNQKVSRRVHLILAIATKLNEKRIENNLKQDYYADSIQIHFDGYAEPGYSDPESGIVALGNWNGAICSRVRKLFEKMGVECEWSESWDYCDACGKLVRTSPNGYGWLASYLLKDSGNCTCHECLLQDPEKYLALLEDNADKAITLDVNPEDYGYKLYASNQETGCHPGQCSDPRAFAKELRAKGKSRFVFKIDASEQFTLVWSVYLHESEADSEPEIDDDTSWDYENPGEESYV
jgi:hypothetical protein